MKRPVHIKEHTRKLKNGKTIIIKAHVVYRESSRGESTGIVKRGDELDAHRKLKPTKYKKKYALDNANAAMKSGIDESTYKEYVNKLLTQQKAVESHSSQQKSDTSKDLAKFIRTLPSKQQHALEKETDIKWLERGGGEDVSSDGNVKNKRRYKSTVSDRDHGFHIFDDGSIKYVKKTVRKPRKSDKISFASSERKKGFKLVMLDDGTTRVYYPSDTK